MMNFARLAFALSLGLLSATMPAHAQDSIYLYLSDSANQAAFIDEPGIVRDGDTRTYWTLYVFYTPAAMPGTRDVSTRREQRRDNCRLRTSDVLQHLTYDEAGAVVVTDRRDQEPRPVRAGSNGEGRLAFVCEGRLVNARTPLLTEQQAIQLTRRLGPPSTR